MIVKTLHPYLDIVAAANPSGIFYEYKTPRGKEYKIHFYKANELDPIRTFACISTAAIYGEYIEYYLVSKDGIDWGDDCKLSKGVRNFVDRLVSLSIFM